MRQTAFFSSGAPRAREARAWAEPHSYGNLPIQENLVITWPTDRATDRPSVRPTGIPMFTLTLSRFGSPGGSWLHINVVINWQLSKQDIRWPVSPDRIAGSGVDPSRSSIFLKLSADNFFVFKWLQAHAYFFFKFISNMLCLCQYRPALSNLPQTQKFSQFF